MFSVRFYNSAFPSSLSCRIMGLYVSVVLVIGKFVRGFFSEISHSIMFEELPCVDRILKLCTDIFLVSVALYLFYLILNRLLQYVSALPSFTQSANSSVALLICSFWSLVFFLPVLQVRETGELELEEELYSKLIFLYRSPETMIKWTRDIHNQDRDAH